MKQLKYPDLGITYRGGWCEKGVEEAFGTTGIYTSAMVACRNNIIHNETPPSGLYVPIYIDLPNGPYDENGTQGDVAISCPDGTVAACALGGVNTGLYKYPSLQAYIDDYSRVNNGAIYQGWGEYAGNIKVVGDNMDEQKVRESIGLLMLATQVGEKAGGYASDGQVDYYTRAIMKDPSSGFKELAKDLLKSSSNEAMRWKAFDNTAGYPALVKKVKELEEQPAGEFVKLSDIYIKK